MIRNLLYSFCLHLLFLFVLTLNDMVVVNNPKSTSITSFDFGSNFNIYGIQTTDSDKYSNLSLEDKIKIYKYKMEHKDEILTQNNLDYITKNTEDVKQLSTDNLLDLLESKVSDDKRDKIYLGPTDYAKFQRRLEMLKNGDLGEEQQERLMSTSGELQKQIVSYENKKTNSGNGQNLKVVDDKTRQISNEMKNIDINEIFTKDDLAMIKRSIAQNNMSNLSNREKKIIQQQLESCWRTAISKNNRKSKVGVVVEVELSRNGFFNMKNVKMKIIDIENKYSKSEYDNTIQNAKTALVYCSPLRNLPTLKYESWKKINFIFSEGSTKKRGSK